MAQINKYDVILDTIPSSKYRKEILFRLAGDDSIMVEYGRVPEIDYMDVFRQILVSAEVNKRASVGYTQMDGFLEAVPTFRTAQYRFDPRKKSIKEMVAAIKDIELAVGDERDIERADFNSPLIEMPIAFEDPLVKEANERYLREVKRAESSVDIDPVYGDSITYMANYVGISREEWKEKFLSTEWLSYAMGFFIGLIIAIPVDRRNLLRTSKSNPPRVYSPRNTVCLGSFICSWYTVDAPGGYHLIGRTGPLLDMDQKHPSFKEDVALAHTLDRLKFYEVSVEEQRRIEQLVDSGSSEYIYKKTPGRFSVGEWREFERQHKDEIDKWLRQVEEFAAKAPIP
jgi:urea carboxylase